MTQDELNRAQAGFRIKSDISAYHNKISDLTNELELVGVYHKGRQISVGHCSVDGDLIVAAFTEQIERYKQKIAELQKEFDEL